MGDKTSRYRLTEIYTTSETQTGHATRRLQVGKKSTSTISIGDVVDLTSSEFDRLSRFARFEEVSPKEAPKVVSVDVAPTREEIDAAGVEDLKSMASRAKISAPPGAKKEDLQKLLHNHYHKGT